MIPVTNPNHPTAHQSPEPTLDMVEQFGHGTKQPMSTGADMAERSLQVEITNPGMRFNDQAGTAVREEKRRITARPVDVAVRSGNQDPKAVIDKNLSHSFIWGYKGTGQDPTPPQPGFFSQMPPWGWIALAAGGVALTMMVSGRKRS